LAKKRKNKNKYRDVVEYYGSRKNNNRSYALAQTKPEDIRKIAYQVFGSLYVESESLK
jgi:neutral trehalase